MNKAIKATIGGIIDNENTNLLDKFFKIPAYQRLYEWETIHIETLLDDMKKAWKPDDCQSDKSNEDSQKSVKPYFIGNITTSIDKDDNNKFVLIDGQQRLTTLWFIGFYLASKKCGEWDNFIAQDDKLRIAMPIRENEEKALKELAMKIRTIKPNENGEINLYAYLPSDIHQKIINAFECIEKWFNARFGKYINGKLEIDLKQLKCFSLFIYIRVRFVFVELAQNTDLNRFFVRMNNRGKQLEKHEILKARILSVIQQGGGDWQKYAKIWDLCSDMNKYIFQSASDRNFLNSENEGGEKWGIDKIIGEFDDKSAKGVQNDDAPDKVESIIDFPTFLLHCYKLYAHNNSKNDISISKDKLLDIFDLDSGGKWDSESCKCFITDMLYYRVLFDYFVIKNNAKQGNGFRIRRLQSYKDKNQKTYYRLPEDSKSVADSPLHNLAMIQNYLRVARQGDRQNYHHWLTPFLRFLDIKEMVNKEHLNFESNSWEPDEICENFIVNTTNDTNKQSDFENSSVEFLENLDTTLANKNDNEQSGELIKTTNAILAQMTSHYKETQLLKWTFLKDNKKWDFLKYGNAIRYWFYRLEYYLWKWGTLDKEDFETQCKEKFGNKFDVLKIMFNVKLGTQHNFKSIAKNFYFRNLNSVEHFHPQHLKKQNGWDTYINYFGNLALISGSINSQYSDQLPKEKKEDLKNKLNKKGGNTESLKFFLMCAQCEYDKDEWEYKKNVENKHEKYMLEILKESLSLNPNDSQNSSELQESN